MLKRALSLFGVMDCMALSNKNGNNGDRTRKIKSKQWRCVINCPVDVSEPVGFLKALLVSIRSFCSVAQMQFACILHDRDFKEDGTPKTPHIHCVFWDSVSSSKKSFINLLALGLKLPEDVITCDVCPRPTMAIQYLVHMNAPEKAIYLDSEIVTNCDKKVKQLLYIDLSTENNFGTLSDIQILNLIKEGISYSGLISLVGIKQAKEWISSFSYLKEECNRGTFYAGVNINYQDS